MEALPATTVSMVAKPVFLFICGTANPDRRSTIGQPERLASRFINLLECAGFLCDPRHLTWKTKARVSSSSTMKIPCRMYLALPCNPQDITFSP